MTDETSNEKSRYNEANLQILRLHDSWIYCKHCRRNALYDQWKWELDDVWSELVADVEKDRTTLPKQKVIETHQELRRVIGLSKTRNEMYEAINKLQNFLKLLQDDVGKGGAYADGTEEDID